ncbi:MAG: DUF4389 domain-containing protein [Deltaproteobacteria bacterium]|nr:DUF4389 domain-containing protein [Deltaproteobacteria bacterium]
MLLSIERQESYSRGQLLLRTIFGGIYIALPHVIVLSICNLWTAILGFVAWWAILFTGRHPESMFEWQVKIRCWVYRLNASLYNMIDSYPAIGPNGTNDQVTVDIPYPESMGRGLLLVKTFFGAIYCGVPHAICLYGRLIATAFLNFLAWWSVLFTGNYPAGWHEFNVGTFRWMLRFDMYLNNLSDDYPPFTGKEL